MTRTAPDNPRTLRYPPRWRAGLFGCVSFLGLFNFSVNAQEACDTLLIVDFSVSVDGYVATFTDLTSNDLSDVHYYWDYGDGVIEHLGQYQYTYADTGTYTACLIVSGSTGADTCAATTCHQLRIDLPPVPPTLRVWPMPFTEGFSVAGSEVEGAERAELYDAMGRLVTTTALAMNPVLDFLFPGLSAEHYVLVVTGPGMRRMLHVVRI